MKKGDRGVENPQPMRTPYVERYAEDVRLVPPGKEKPADGRQKLTYEYLASLAVMPDPEHEDVNDGDVHDRDGAYADSPLGAEVGLHIHAEADRWYETEPERPVHFIVEHSKIAAVYPDGVVNRLRSSWGDDWRQIITRYYPDRLAWLDRLLQDNPEITMDQVLARRGYEHGGSPLPQRDQDQQLTDVVKDVTWFIPDGSEPYVHIQLESS